jgi:hypothetical protein
VIWHGIPCDAAAWDPAPRGIIESRCGRRQRGVLHAAFDHGQGALNAAPRPRNFCGLPEPDDPRYADWPFDVSLAGEDDFAGPLELTDREGAMTDFIAKPTPETAAELLSAAGVTCSGEEVQILARDERWAVPIGRERIAWFPASEPGSRRLAVERRVLSLIAERCSFLTPRLVFVSPRGFDIRQMVPGRCDPWGLYHRCRADSRLAQRIGRAIGAIVAEQHTRISEADVAGWLPLRVRWPQAGDRIREGLPLVVDDSGFIRAMEEVIERYEAVPVRADDRVLIHGDVGFHNLALDAQSDTINGIFDYDSAAWADRHHDFRYLLFDAGREDGEDMLEAALGVYESAAARSVDRNRVRLYNAASAISFLSFRVGTPADEKSCGRTLAEDIRWVRAALSKLAT